MLNELVKFAKENHPEFAPLPNVYLEKWFLVYKNTTLICRVGGKIMGFALYQEWPDRLNFICICGKGNWYENLQRMLAGSDKLPDKPICFFDEKAHKLRIIQRK